MNEPRVVESVTNECQSLGRAHESSSARAEQLIACLEGEIAKRDEELAACRVAVENCEVFRSRIAELEARIVWLECEAQVNAAPVSEAKAQGEYGDAYQGAREDLAIWKRRALEAEEKVRHQEQIIDRMGEDLNAINGPTFMGEPVIRDTVEVSRKAIQRLFKAAGCSGSVGNSEVLNAASDRLKAAHAQQVSVPASAFASRAITHYEAALLAAFPSGSSGEVLNQWNEARRVLAAAPAAPAADAWIPVSERLPNIAQEVIVHSEFDGVCAGVLDSYGEWFAPCSEYKLIRVTSWMPMPTKIEANRHD